MENNKSLFWYGFFGSLKQKAGGGIIILSIIFTLIIHPIFIIGIIGGIILLMKGKSQRFDYQRRSGYIMHGGDR